ncbi:hypothetical protein [Variovorax sp. KK3]|uniref:hypothetical protein n=1 Tax=Variovorax sp. KK3 TaxID=1855728 RepID=UPI00117E1B6B|nr:hypothetical protein [Variovorax sp. KK3]
MADTVRVFGQSIGLPELALDDQGSLRLATEDGGVIGLIAMDVAEAPLVLVYRSALLSYSAERKLRRALRLADAARIRLWPAQVAVLSDALVIALRMPQRDFTPDALESALVDLERMHADLDGRG